MCAVYKVNGCAFRDDLLYKLSENLWLEKVNGLRFKVGLLQITQTTFGKIHKLTLKPEGTVVEEGRPLALIEARKFLGHVNSPFKAKIVKTNKGLDEKPHIAQESPYDKGWLYVIEALDEGFINRLERWDDIRSKVESELLSRGIMCFDIVPDYVYAAIGIDCSQVIMVLSDKVSEIPVGSVLHVVADYDAGSELQLQTWAAATGNEVLDFRVEKKLAHALIRRKV